MLSLTLRTEPEFVGGASQLGLASKHGEGTGAGTGPLTPLGTVIKKNPFLPNFEGHTGSTRSKYQVVPVIPTPSPKHKGKKVDLRAEPWDTAGL